MKKNNKNEVEAKIEYQKIIGEVNKGGFQPIRFTRIKYKSSDQTHIDIRKYQRAPGQEEENDYEDIFYPTKLGFHFSEKEFIKVIKEYTIMPDAYIHHEIIIKSFKLFKCIETKIRKLIRVSSDEIGIKLIRKAFHPENGQLTDMELPISERESFTNYIAGAFGFYKNPCSHRDVELDFITAFDRIVVASDLLKIIDKSEKKINEIILKDIPF